MTDDRPLSILEALSGQPELMAFVESLSPFSLRHLEQAWRESSLSAEQFVRELLAAPDDPGES